MKKGVIKIISILVATCLLPTACFAYHGAFSQKTETILESVIGNKWSTVPDSDTWISSVTGDEIHWQADHQKEYYYDILYNTTAPYIWGENGYGLGSLTGAGSGEGIVAVARQELELGIKEIPKGSNRTKYGDYVWGAGSVLPWCAAFVSWCANQCGLIESGVFNKTAGCRELYNHLHSTGAGEIMTIDALRSGGLINEVKPGDILFFKNGQLYAHVGIIEQAGIDQNGRPYIITIEGNSSDMVARRIYYENSSGNTAKMAINGCIVRPNYPTQEGDVNS